MNTASSADFLSGGGEMGARMRSYNWSETPIGSVQNWPPSLKTAVRIMLTSRQPMFVWWGPQLVNLYNDAYRSIVGGKHPKALGQPAAKVWKEIWDQVGPRAESAMLKNEGTYDEALLLIMERHGYAEETYYTFSYSPVPADHGGAGGIICANTDETQRIIGQRQSALLRQLSSMGADARSLDEACHLSSRAMATNPHDLPFSMIYVVDNNKGRAHLVETSGIDRSRSRDGVPEQIDLAADSIWPIAEVLSTHKPALVSNVERLFQDQPKGPWDRPARQAVVLPIGPIFDGCALPGLHSLRSSLDGCALPGLHSLRSSNQVGKARVLIAGLNPFRVFDDSYKGFLELVAAQIFANIGNGQAYEEERRRAESLAELDRAKTTFFSNISHEFRTPLTLMLGPIEDAFNLPSPALSGENLDTAYRSALRLSKLVNALLDFSRIEAGRVNASFEPTDLSALTGELATVFRSAIERAGLQLSVQCQPMTSPVFVDREMWEKVVMNLLSNALKFTFEGKIEVSVRSTEERVVVSVADTGVGISEEDITRLFERFHRIEGVKARTHEGSGIGLALVQELVRIHGGEITVKSVPGAGTTFSIHLPFGSSHLPQEKIVARKTVTSLATRVAALAEESLQWIPGEEGSLAHEVINPPHPHDAGVRILLVDDNADMRRYVARLLRVRWIVETATDGLSALQAIRDRPPTLVITDVMMPNLDGFGLLRELRRDPATRAIPVVMLSARAGEEARLEGLEAGADDYVIKPFTARELIARVATRLDLDRAHQRLEVLAEEAGAANRAKDEFLAMLGHELRNPLSPILTALQLMRLQGKQSAELDMIERQVGHLTRLVDDLLDVSRITRGKIQLRKRLVQLAPVVNRAIYMVSPLIEERRQPIHVAVPREGLMLEVDEDRMAQVIANLLTNAAKYSDPKSHITIQAERRQDRIRLSVKDEGMGIAPQAIDRIFDLFVQQTQTLARSGGGLGLGLAIVRSLVVMHGGSVSVHSEGPGMGSEFVVDLPAAQPGSADSPVLTRVSADEVGDRNLSARILVVDDNTDAAEGLRQLLGAIGYLVEVANDGPTALKTARVFQPNLALVDIGLPVMDGYELAQRLRELRDLRLIAVTGYGQESDKQKALDAGFDFHLVKPVDFAKLQRMVDELIEPHR